MATTHRHSSEENWVTHKLAQYAVLKELSNIVLKELVGERLSVVLSPIIQGAVVQYQQEWSRWSALLFGLTSPCT